MTGIRNASVLPLPVTAYNGISMAPRAEVQSYTSTTTSLCPMNNGMQLACTGVMRSKPMLATASRIHCESSGVRPSHARFFCALSLATRDSVGAIIDCDERKV